MKMKFSSLLVFNRYIFVCLFLSICLDAQSEQVIPLSNHIGYDLDAEENLYYQIFTDLPSFESAKFFMISKDRIEARISFVEFSQKKVNLRAYSLKEFSDMQFKTMQMPPITESIRESFRKNLTYLRTRDILRDIPKGQYVIIEDKNSKKIKGTLLGFSRDRLFIQTPISVKQIPITRMVKISYRDVIAQKPELKGYVYGAAAFLGFILMESWNRQTRPDWQYKWNNRFSGLILGLIGGAELYDTAMILITPKTNFSLTSGEQEKILDK